MLRRFLSMSGCVFELVKGAIILAAILVIVNYFVATLLIVRGSSMEPNYNDGEMLILDKIHYTFGLPQRGDVVGLRFPGSPDKRKFIKRIIGLPGEKVEITQSEIKINGQKLDEPYINSLIYYQNLTEIVPSGEYFVMGDNRYASSDSREWGTVPKAMILGRTWLRLWPLDKIGITQPARYSGL